MRLALPDVPFQVEGGLRSPEPLAVADTAILSTFAAWLGADTKVEKFAGRPGISGHYRVSRQHERYFVRVLSNDAADHAHAVVRLTMMWSASAPVIRSVDAAPVRFGSEHVALRYPWIDGLHPEADAEELFEVGRALARLHTSMAQSAEADRVFWRASERTKALRARLERGLPNRALSILAGFPTAFDALNDLPSGPLHGDLNPGNVIINISRHAVFFCDFEDALHSYGPPIVDLAFLVERLCLDSESGLDAALALFQGYIASRKGAPIVRPNALFEAIALLNLRAVIILVLLSESGRSPDESEWSKFANNMARLDLTAPKITAIEQAVIGMQV